MTAKSKKQPDIAKVAERNQGRSRGIDFLSHAALPIVFGIVAFSLGNLQANLSSFRNGAQQVPEDRAIDLSESMAFWSRTSDEARWAGDMVLQTAVGSTRFAMEMGKLLFVIEEEFPHLTRNASNIGGWQSKDITGFPDPLFQEFATLLHKPFVEFLRKGLRQRLPARLADIENVAVAAVVHELWANVNRAGDWNVVHDHGPADNSHVCSGVYYPLVNRGHEGKAADRKKASIKFFLPAGTVDVSPSPGLLLLFPPHLRHEVAPMQVEEDPRVSLAFNLRVRWLDQPILRAAIAGENFKISTLVEQRADIEAADGVLRLRAMHLAAEAGHVATVDKLIELGADSSALSWEGWSPLGIAAERGHLPLVQRLGGKHASRFITPIMCSILNGGWNVSSLALGGTCCLPKVGGVDIVTGDATICKDHRSDFD